MTVISATNLGKCNLSCSWSRREVYNIQNKSKKGCFSHSLGYCRFKASNWLKDDNIKLEECNVSHRSLSECLWSHNYKRRSCWQWEGSSTYIPYVSCLAAARVLLYPTDTWFECHVQENGNIDAVISPKFRWHQDEVYETMDLPC